MPELPEVETIVRQLQRVLLGKVIEKVEVRGEKFFEGSPTSLKLCGVKKVGRKQKIIAITLSPSSHRWVSLKKGESKEKVLLVHLKMTGQLIYEPRIKNQELKVVGGHPTADWVSDLPSKHTRVIISFTDGSKLFFNDQRKFGWMRLMTNDKWQMTKKLMPPDVVDEEFTIEYLTRVLSKSGRAVKLVILDQAKIGGMGNIYACDALYLAKIHPEMPANQLKLPAVKQLYRAMKRVIDKGIEMGGASMSHYVGIEGFGGHYQDHFLVYNKAGEKCGKCGTMIEKMKLGGRGTYWCSKCQYRKI